MEPSNEVKKLKTKIKKYEQQLEGTTDPVDRTALLKMLAALLEEKVLLLQSEQSEQACMGKRDSIHPHVYIY